MGVATAVLPSSTTQTPRQGRQRGVEAGGRSRDGEADPLGPLSR